MTAWRTDNVEENSRSRQAVKTMTTWHYFWQYYKKFFKVYRSELFGALSDAKKEATVNSLQER